MLTSLRNLYEYNHFKILCEDGFVGTIDDFLLDDQRWGVRYLVAQLRNGRKIAVCPIAIDAIDWEARSIESDPVNLGVNQQLLDYYGRPAR